MASQGGGQSIVGALLNALNPYAYTDYINYINKEHGVTRRDFENSALSEYYTLDLSQCYNGNHINADMLYDIFRNYSQTTCDGVSL